MRTVAIIVTVVAILCGGLYAKQQAVAAFTHAVHKEVA